MEDFLEKTLQHSFSIAVAAYLLVRMDKRIEELTKGGADKKLDSS